MASIFDLILVTMRFLNGRKLIDGRSDDAQTLAKLSLVDDQGRGEADYISVSWLGLRGKLLAFTCAGRRQWLVCVSTDQ